MEQLPAASCLLFYNKETRPSGRDATMYFYLHGGMSLKEFPQNPPEKKREINGTVYTVTAHFKENGRTAADQIRQMIDRATKEEKIRKTM